MFDKSPGLIAAVMDSDFIALAVVDDRRVVWANALLHRIYGFAPGELLGRSVREPFLDDKSFDVFGARARAAIADGKAFGGMFPQRRKDGSTGWYEFQLAAVPGDPGKIVCAVFDRTESQRVQQQLELSEARFRAVVQDQTEVIGRVAADGAFLFVNDVYCKVFGRSREELIGHHWRPVAHPDDVPMIEAKLAEMSPDKPVVQIENRVFVAGDQVRWMQFVNRGIYRDDGTLVEIQAVGRDITSLKETEASLRASDDRLEMALAGSGLVLWDWNISQRKVAPGKRWFDLLGYTDDELGDDEDAWMQLIDPRDIDAFRQKLAAHLTGDSAAFESQHRLRHKKGHWVDVEARGQITLRADDGRPLRMVGTLKDISSQKRLSEQGLDMLSRIESLIRGATSGTHGPAPDSRLQLLTRRERQILALIGSGLTSPQVARNLNLSTHTVMSHRRNLMAKLDLHSAVDMARFAARHGVVPDP